MFSLATDQFSDLSLFDTTIRYYHSPLIYTPNKCTKFHQIKACIHKLSKVCKKKTKKERFFSKVLLLLSGESSSNFECGIPWVEGTYTVNLVPFGSGVRELRMCENRNFGVPVNILTLFVRPVFLCRTTTMCLDFYLFKVQLNERDDPLFRQVVSHCLFTVHDLNMICH